MMTIASETLLGISINGIVYTMQVCNGFKLSTLSQSTHLWNLYAMICFQDSWCYQFSH